MPALVPTARCRPLAIAGASRPQLSLTPSRPRPLGHSRAVPRSTRGDSSEREVYDAPSTNETMIAEECPNVPPEMIASYEDFPRVPGIRRFLVNEEQLVALIGRLFEVVAVTVMTLYGVKAMMLGLFELPQFVASSFKIHGASPEESEAFREVFKLIREDLSDGILLGLEFLIVADVFETVGKPLQKRCMDDLYKLALVVVIRTVIDLSLNIE